jgi:hypothetical protein
MSKRILGLGLVAGLLAALAIAVPAQAAGVKAACTLTGTAKTTPPVLLQGGGGTYQFKALQFVCVGVAKGAPAVDVINVTSNGSYVNVVCGTGKAWSKPGQSTLTAGPAKYGPIVNSLGYEVDFVATVGLFNWKAGSGKGVPGVKPLSDLGIVPDPKTGTNAFGGVIQLGVPDPTAAGKPPTVPGPGECTKAFQATGAVVIDTGNPL